jgi:competence/damage-inducible protein CinA-like protein
MRASIIAVGSELLTPFRLDTNSLAITAIIDELGYDVHQKMVVGDDVEELVRAIRGALARADLIVVTGGLGPTEDDVTRDALAQVFDAPLEPDSTVLDRLRERFAARGIVMAANNARQALVPRGAEILENARGTAPGLWLERGATILVALPGPPREMKPMLEAVARGRLAGRSPGTSLYRRVIKITGRPESDVDASAAPIYSRWRDAEVPISTTILAVMGQIELHLTARASDRSAADRALDRAVAELAAALGRSVYSVNGDPLEAVVGALLRERGLHVAVAESCTGGLLTSRLTDVAGSSDYVDRGVVCYSNRAKTELLGVPSELIARHGAVSEPVAVAMAEGVRARSGVGVGIGVTGIAGPGGGTTEKPVGTVALAVAVGDQLRVRTVWLLGTREQVKFQAAQAAMNLLRLMLLDARDEALRRH